MQKSIDEIKTKIAPILKKYGIKKAGIFGSYARGEVKEGSDIDILVEFEKSIGLIDFIGAEIEMSDVLGVKVDLVTEGALKPRIKENILNSLVQI